MLVIIGPFFLYMLAYAFLGKKWTALYVLIDVLADAPQYINQGTGGASSASPITQAVLSPTNPLEMFFAAHLIFSLTFLIALLGIESVFIRYFFIEAWRNVKRIRIRVPPGLIK